MLVTYYIVCIANNLVEIESIHYRIPVAYHPYPTATSLVGEVGGI